MVSKKLLAVAVIAVVVIIVIAAAAAAGGSKSATNNDNNNSNNNDNTDNTPTTREQIANVTLTGNTDAVTDKFTLQAGVTIFHITYAGTSYFGVTLKDANGEHVDLLANEIGAYTGDALIGVKDGNYAGAEPGQHFLDIQAEGAWTISIEQPRVSSSTSVPTTISGHGDDASVPIMLTNGVAVFNITYEGSDYFGVDLWADDGEYVELLANEIGDYIGEKSVTVNSGILSASSGIHWLDIDGAGAWTIKITKM